MLRVEDISQGSGESRVGERGVAGDGAGLNIAPVVESAVAGDYSGINVAVVVERAIACDASSVIVGISVIVESAVPGDCVIAGVVNTAIIERDGAIDRALTPTGVIKRDSTINGAVAIMYSVVAECDIAVNNASVHPAVAIYSVA